MVLPGWNISEPIDLAYKLYEVVESLRSAPESAKAFVSKINNFSGNLKELQRILEDDTTSRSSQDLEHLRATIVECQACVKRCEEYSEGFGKLTKDGRGKMDGAGQAARWALQEKRAAKLREEIDGQIGNIGLTLAIKTFGDGRTRQGSHLGTEGLKPPLRSGTIASLPPYSSPRSNWTQTESLQHAKTPAELLGLGTQHKRKSSDTDIPNFQLESEGSGGKGMNTSLQTNLATLHPLTEPNERSELDSKEALKPLGSRRNTTNEVAVSPTGLGMSSTLSEGSSVASRDFTSPTISSRRTSMTEVTTSTSRRDSILALDFAVMEIAMENLSGVKVSYYKAKSRISYAVSTIESFRNKQTGRRYIIVSPPISSNIKLYLVPPTERIIAHSEHPQAYGSTTRHRVKFIEPYLLRSQKTSSERQPTNASTALSPSLTPVSSAASIVSSRSLGSPVIAIDGGVLKEESRRQEYDFENGDDYRRFQELLMGPDVKLQLQVPVQSITASRYGESRPTKESRLQYLRLWQSGGRQTLMYFANSSLTKYREYSMENLRPVESKPKTMIKLEVHLPGRVRRRSSSKSPLIIAKPSAQEQAKFDGYTDENDMVDLDYLSIEFSSAQDKATFLREAKFHGPVEQPTVSP
ncbi:hypothetical protein HO173_010612 [Letharia columbiana]|uniref:Uncharacterized protein n=1 Tax=Letharia columbiana TaxID=112416 RepID=A0A8H6FM75_9LECA|nr:uncharacterized protein HO173_010612 [Letharia columbiana]KAF6231112.1 hypothetical protein HO173_010612 [Letharia columbiana]